MDIKILLDNTALVKGNDFLWKLLERNAGQWKPRGSHFVDAAPRDVRRIIERVTLKEIQHPDIEDDCRAYEADTSHAFARLGIVPIELVSGEVMAKMLDPLRSGLVTPYVYGMAGEIVKHTIFITEVKKGMRVLATFHPGDPAPRPHLKADLLNQKIPVKKLQEMGCTYLGISEESLG